MLPTPIRSRPRLFGSHLPAALASGLMSVALAVGSLAVGVPAAAAAVQMPTINRTLTAGPSGLGGTTYTISGAISGTIAVSATAQFSQPIRETLTYDDANVRQGSTVVVARSVAANGAGSLTVVWTVNGSLVPGTLSPTTTVPCTISFTGPVTCTAQSSSIRLIGPLPIPFTPILDLLLDASVTVTPGGVTVDSATFSGSAMIAGPTSQAEPGTQSVAVPCSAGVGDTLTMKDTNFVDSTSISGSNGPEISIGAWIPNLLPPFIPPAFAVGFASFPVGPPATRSFSQDFVDPSSQATALGSVLHNNIPPVVNAGPSPYSGDEGTPIAFNGSASTSVCGFPTLRWDFSDGGVAFGAHPVHTFTDGGSYSGLLTATDATGLTSTTTFSVNVVSLPPVVAAGPDTSSAWGVPVAFNGSATAPGSADQATLTYSWDFGDGTLPTAPSASGGSGVFHSYTTPGSYTATLTVANHDGQSSSATRTITIVKRTVSVGYLGDTAGTYDTQGALSASLVDQYGSAVNGRSIAFTVNGAAAGSAVTNSSGIGSTAYTPLLSAAPYPTIATFAGDSLYAGGSGSGSITIARKASTTTYTGALSGGPNKTITLSATLVDATGKPLGGRMIVFQLGAQSTSAPTNSSGVASVSLKLAQKNGVYPLTATWTPTGADANHYVGSAASRTFSLQVR